MTQNNKLSELSLYFTSLFDETRNFAENPEMIFLNDLENYLRRKNGGWNPYLTHDIKEALGEQRKIEGKWNWYIVQRQPDDLFYIVLRSREITEKFKNFILNSLK